MRIDRRASGPLAMILLAVVLVGCGTLVPSARLDGTEWILTSLNDDPLVQGSNITLSFADGRAGGFAGCNGYGGNYTEPEEGSLTVGEMAVTLQLCETPAGIMQQENAYLEALASAAGYRIIEDRLEIRNTEGATTLVFDRKIEFPMDPADLVGTEWRLLSINDIAPMAGSTITIAFSGREISGTAGCRAYAGSYEASGDDVVFPFLVMIGAAEACSEALLMQEGEYTTSLELATNYRLTADRLEILTARGEVLIYGPAPDETAFGEVSPSPTVTPDTVPPWTPIPTEAPDEPQVLSFGVTPSEVDPGDTVTLTWEARGDRATMCPSARFVYFTSEDCQDVALAGTMTFTIPLETEGFQHITFILQVETDESEALDIGETSVAFKCPTTWFFSDEPQAGICPVEPTTSYAAAQYFERGTMIWLEQIGRYFILQQALLSADDVRKEIHFIQDPLEILRDTSADDDPPAGFFAPVSGFGLVWRGDVRTSPGYRETLGWALEPEFGYQAVFQCDDALPSGGRSWQTCYLEGPGEEVIVLHPLGGWYLLGER